MIAAMRRRAFITLLGSAAAAWPLAARAQQPAMPVVGFLFAGPADGSRHYAAAFRKGLSDTGNVEGQNVVVEYHWLEGQYDRARTLVADMARRRVAVIASLGGTPLALAAKAATASIPIVFSVPDDPVQLGLVHELVPKAARIAVLVNPTNPASAERTLKEVQAAAPVLGLQIHVFNASTSNEIDVAFAGMVRERCEALLVGGDALFNGRRVQLAIMAARDRLPTSFTVREFVEAGGLMSYGTNLADTFRQVGTYTGSIINGAKPAELPVLQSTKFEFAINLHTAKALGLEVPPQLLASVDEVIE